MSRLPKRYEAWLYVDGNRPLIFRHPLRGNSRSQMSNKRCLMLLDSASTTIKTMLEFNEEHFDNFQPFLRIQFYSVKNLRLYSNSSHKILSSMARILLFGPQGSQESESSLVSRFMKGNRSARIPPRSCSVPRQTSASLYSASSSARRSSMCSKNSEWTWPQGAN